MNNLVMLELLWYMKMLRVNSASKAGAILPTNDLMFKTIFWNKEYPNVLISFINSILKRKDPIQSVELVSTELDTQFIGEHGIRLDLVATTSNGEILNVEMQKKHCDSSL